MDFSVPCNHVWFGWDIVSSHPLAGMYCFGLDDAFETSDKITSIERTQ